jgi:AcrR family transcriptional regulator
MAKGRPRKFDPEQAIGQAMHVFWKKGYERTTLDDLTEATGVSRPSLYAAFGNKESLFLKVLDRYRSDPASYVNRALAKPTAREVFSSLLYGVIDLITDPDNPGGCLFVCGALVSSELASRRIEGEEEILERFQRAVAEGELQPEVDPNTLAKLAATLLWGLSVQGINGSTKKELRQVAKLALDAFPDGGK